VYLDEPYFSGGGHGRVCRSCKEPIRDSERFTRVTFVTDPDGAKGLTGDYHDVCSKPFASIADAISALGRLWR